VASGEPLPVTDQQEIHSTGHAIEFRIYAEDPKTFFPSPGTIQSLNWGNITDVRIDAGYEEGNAVTPYYDPMIAKVIIKESTRSAAIEKAQNFFSSVKIEGIKTNVPLFVAFLEAENFKNGTYTTSELQKWLELQKEEK
jgi:acetyl-CoA carboxylase biotin carboxylase subunit